MENEQKGNLCSFCSIEKVLFVLTQNAVGHFLDLGTKRTQLKIETEMFNAANTLCKHHLSQHKCNGLKWWGEDSSLKLCRYQWISLR